MALGVSRSTTAACRLAARGRRVARRGASACSSSPARRRPPLGLLADISERFPTDRGAIMGLYSVFLAIGQIVGSLIGGFAAELARRSTGCSSRRSACCAIALVRWLSSGARSTTCSTGRIGASRPSRRTRAAPVTGMTATVPLVPMPLARGRARRRRRAAPPRDRGGPGDPPGRRPRGRRGDRDERRARRSSLPSGCGIGGDAFWLIWDDGARPPDGAERLRAGAGRRPIRRRSARRASTTLPLPRAAHDHGAGRRPLVGRRPRPASAACRGRTSSAPAIELARDGFPAWDGFISAVETTLPAVVEALGPGSGFEQVYRPHGRPWRPGERVRLPALAATLERLADGRLRRLLRRRRRRAPGARAGGGRLRRSPMRRPASPHLDLDRADRDRLPRRPGHDPPPNSSGIVALELLNVLETFEPPAPAAFGPDGVADAALDPPRDRGGEARDGRPRRLPDGSRRSSTIPVERLTLEGPRGRARAAGSTRTGRPRPPAVDACRGAAGRSTSRPSTARATRSA